MGLGLQVGGFDDPGTYEALACALLAVGLAPKSALAGDQDEAVYSCGMWGYSGLHHLRRLAAYVGRHKPLPLPRAPEPCRDAELLQFYQQQAPGFEHLLLHSDAEGFYVPYEFSQVIVPAADLGVPGGWIGSSYRLLDECRRLASALALPLNLDPESEQIWAAAQAPADAGPLWQRYGIESFTCIRLIAAAEASIASGAALVFC